VNMETSQAHGDGVVVRAISKGASCSHATTQAQAIAAVNLTRSSLRAVTWVAGLVNCPQSPLSQLRNQKLFHDLFCVVLNSTERELLLVLDSHIVVWFFSTVSLQGSGEILLLLLSLEPTM
jgi:hypothetical protein